jgi:hypothetical protein
MNTFSARENVVLERNWSIIGVHNMAWLFVQMTNPFGKLPCIWDRSREKDEMNIVR